MIDELLDRLIINPSHAYLRSNAITAKHELQTLRDQLTRMGAQAREMAFKIGTLQQQVQELTIAKAILAPTLSGTTPATGASPDKTQT